MFLWNLSTNLIRPSVISVMSGDQNAGQNHSIKIDNSSFERVEQFKYLGTTLTHRNSIQEEIKSRLQSGNAFYHLVQNVLSSSLLSRNINIKMYRTVMLCAVLYGCETWSLTLREERRLKVLENRVLRRIFGPNRDEVRGEWRKLHNVGLNDLYCWPNIVRVIKWRMGWVGHVARKGECKRRIQGFGGETWDKEPTWKTWHRWEDNIKTGLKEVGWGGLDWIALAQDRDRWRALVNAVMNLWVP